MLIALLVPPVAASAGVTGLPDHFGLGVAGSPDNNGLTGWMPNSGVPWDYAYQYLAAGVNTGAGWTTWNDQAQFPLLYAQSAHAHGYLPVFPYYMLLQSNGPCAACGEPEKDLAHLNDATLMSAYYADFALLMKRLGGGVYDGIRGYGGTAIVHVEPDLSGYANAAVLDNTNCFAHCTGQGNDPSLLKAAVASSGNADVTGFANTYKGFSLALAHLRDLYAPNVLLAFHISGWAPLIDAGSNTDPSVNVRDLGKTAATFAVSSGLGSGYSIVFNDVADRDAGFYRATQARNTWWDRLNVTLPNFHQWETFMQGVHDTTTAPVIIWQIPVGNQVYRTMNNSDGHYQDNRVEYFFAHIDELKPLGIVGLLFGAGADGPTHQYDFKSDGVTNPPSFCTGEGPSSGQICNTAVSASSDDDGGYLRETAAAFYGKLSSLVATVGNAAITVGQPVDVSGALRCPDNASPGGRTVSVERRTVGGSFTSIATRTTASDGSIPAVTDRPSASSEYRLRYDGSADCARTVSPLKAVGVRVFVTIDRATSSLRRGSTAVINGRVVPSHPSRRVQLQYLDGRARTWRPAGSGSLDRAGRYRLTYRRTTSGFLVFRVVFAGQDGDHLGNVSPSTRVDWR
ncbi:MAG: hypothetical protein NVSMB57_04410 [Actinomycetota bacterium]